MPNRQLTAAELSNVFAPLLAHVRQTLVDLADGDEALRWALRRKLSKELSYDERSKPMQRKALKAKKRIEQRNLCAICGELLAQRGAELDRFEAMGGYTPENTRLICHECHVESQAARGYH